MRIFPAIDLYKGKAVRLYKGDYQQMTVYSENPVEVAKDFVTCGAEYLHIVDLEGAKTGNTPNLELICHIQKETGLLVEVGGGIRSMDIVERYLQAGIFRVILGTAAVTDAQFLQAAVKTYQEKIAVGIDIKDGYVAIKGWTEQSTYSCDDFFAKMEDMGVQTVICTDISRDGAMQGTNQELYARLADKFSLQIIASGGVSSLEDILALQKMHLYGAIIGKAYYTGDIDLKKAIEVSR